MTNKTQRIPNVHSQKKNKKKKTTHLNNECKAAVTAGRTCSVTVRVLRVLPVRLLWLIIRPEKSIEVIASTT